jgi:hypothetical protein
MTAKEYDRNFNVHFGQPLLKIESVQIGKLYIQYEAARHFFPSAPQKVLG